MAGADTETRAVVVLVVSGVGRIVGHVGPQDGCDLDVLDDLLALCLAARRRGAVIRLVDVHPEIAALSELLGVSEVLGL